MARLSLRPPIKQAGEIAFAVPPPVPTCIYASEFQTWCDQLLTRACADASVATLNLGIVLLTDKYFEWRQAAPRGHQSVGRGARHRCLFTVYEETYTKLREAKLRLSPEPLFVLPPLLPVPAPPVPIPAIVIGEVGE